MEHLLTNEIFIILLSLIFLIFAVQEGPMRTFGKVDDITKMKLPPSTTSYMRQFSSGLQGVEVGWSAIVLVYAVMNVVLLVAVLAGHGPFLIVLRPSLVYPELITNVAILFGNRLACGVLSGRNPSALACFLSSSAKIIGILMGFYRWLATIWIWWFVPVATDALRRVASTPAMAVEFSRRLRRSGRGIGVLRSALPLRSSGSDASFRKMLRRRLTKSMASESQILSQISSQKSPGGDVGADAQGLPWGPSRSMNSILDSMALEDCEDEARDEPPAIRAERRLAAEQEAPSTESLPSSWDGKEGVRIVGEEEGASAREDIRQACRVVGVVMAPESVVMGWPQSAPMNTTMKGPPTYDDWKFLLWGVRTLHSRRHHSSSLDEYGLLETLCDKALESGCGPRVSLSTGLIEDDDELATEGPDEEDLSQLTPGQRAARVLGVTSEKPDKEKDSLVPGEGNLISVESYLFAKFASIARGDSIPEAHPRFDPLPPLRTSESKDKGVQVNTLSESAIRKLLDGQRGHERQGVRIVSFRDAFVQVNTLPPRFLNRKVA